MGSKIVSIGMTILMLMLCLLSVITLNVINKERDVDMNKKIIGTSAVSTDMNILNSKDIIVDGSSLISSIVGIYQIDNRILDSRDKIYTIGDNSPSGGTVSVSYTFLYNGTRSNPEIVKMIQPDKLYKLKYNVQDNSTTGIASTVIEISLADT